MPRPRARAVGESMSLPAQPDPVAGLESGAASSGFVPELSTNFLALIDNHTAAPPDTMGAVGPNHLMVILNSEVAFQTRQGQYLNKISLQHFWASLGYTSGYDPRVAYNPTADRWVAVTLADPHLNSSAILIATSASPDPTGAWNLSAIAVNPAPGLTNEVWADYPNLGANGRWVVVTVNLYGVSSNNFVHAELFSFDQQKLFSGDASYTRLSDPGFNLVPASTFDAGETNLYLLTEAGERNLRLTKITGLVGQEKYDTNGLITPSVSGWDFSPGITNFLPQAGTNVEIFPNDSRIQNVVFRNGSLWCAQTVFLPSGTNVNHSAVQWWQLGTNAAILQRGRLEDTNAVIHYAFPSLAVNRNNDVLIGYSRFAASQFASGNYAYRLANDATNTLRTDTVLKAGVAPYRGPVQPNPVDPNEAGRNSWGDFSNTVVDPLNDTDMWTIQEYAEAPDSLSDRWGTWWGYLRFQSPSAPVNDTFANRIQLSGATVSAGESNAEASVEPGEPPHAHEPGGRSVWWTWTAPGSGLVTLTTEGSNFDTLLAVYTGSTVSNLTEVASDDDSGANLASRVTFTATGGTQYQIAVDGYTGFAGNIRLSLTMSPADWPPTVSITSPTNGAIVVETGTVAILASAADSDGSVAKVVFLNGKVQLGEATAPPYTFSLTNVVPGSYALTARATDDRGLTTSSSLVTLTVVPTNFPPTATIASPTNGAAFFAPANVTLEVDATDQDGTVTKVELFQETSQGPFKLTESDGAPFLFALAVPSPGSYSFIAVATDNGGATSAPVSVSFTVALSPPPNDSFTNRILLSGLTVATNGTTAGATKEPGEPNHAGNGGGRSVWWFWTAPAYGIATISTAGSTFDTTLGVYTGDAVTNLSLVSSNDDRSSTDRTSQLTFGASRGTTYQIAVDGYRDTNGAVASGSVTLNISLTPTNVPPSVEIVNTIILSTFTSPANLTLQASAMDVDGSISRVDFLVASSNQLGSVTTPPYDLLWTNVLAGTYVLTARATDDQGATNTSAPVTIRVAPRPASLASPRFATNLQFQLLLAGEPNLQYRIDASTNLVNWAPLTNLLVSPDGAIVLTDAAWTNFRARFYRAVLGP
ncbi:MAG: Ig-like domain-containing protein [Limisphaerales bacterium]